MNRKRLLLRVAAIVSSVSLTAAFIAYRAGALDSLISGLANAQQREMFSSSKSLITLVVPNGPAVRLPGSKSDLIAVPSRVQEDATLPADRIEPSNVLMYGSKSGVLVQEHFTPAPATDPTKTPPAMMGGSKSITLPSTPAPSGKAKAQP